MNISVIKAVLSRSINIDVECFDPVPANHDKIIVKSTFLLNKKKINKTQFSKTPFIAAKVLLL